MTFDTKHNRHLFNNIYNIFYPIVYTIYKSTSEVEKLFLSFVPLYSVLFYNSPFSFIVSLYSINSGFLNYIHLDLFSKPFSFIVSLYSINCGFLNCI